MCLKSTLLLVVFDAVALPRALGILPQGVDDLGGRQVTAVAADEPQNGDTVLVQVLLDESSDSAVFLLCVLCANSFVPLKYFASRRFKMVGAKKKR